MYSMWSAESYFHIKKVIKPTEEYSDSNVKVKTTYSHSASGFSEKPLSSQLGFISIFDNFEV